MSKPRQFAFSREWVEIRSVIERLDRAVPSVVTEVLIAAPTPVHLPHHVVAVAMQRHGAGGDRLLVHVREGGEVQRIDQRVHAVYQVALDSQPRGPVTVSVTPAADSDPDLGATPARLTFTTSNWSTGQTVTVSAADDQDGTVGTATFRHAATSTDPEYSGIEIADVTAAENDDEYAHFIPFFPSASTAVQGFARIINRSDEAGVVYIFGIDDDGERHGPARLALSRETLHDNSIGVVDTGLPRTQDVLSEARVSRFGETGNPLGDDDTPGETHGLWVAGLAAGYGNGPTRRGVNPHSALVFVDVERARTSFLGGLGCKIGVLNSTFVTNVVQGIKTAIKQGAQVVNVSWGDGSVCSDRQSSRLSSRRSFRLDKVGAMHYAREKDALVVWSSGDSCENRPIPVVSSERPCSIRRRRLSHLRGRGEPGVPGVEGAGNSRRADRDAMVENGMASTGTDGAGVHRGG